MRIFNRHINPGTILKILLSIAVMGLFVLLLGINKINKILNSDLGFNKSDIISLRTKDSKTILPDSLIYSSEIPGLYIHNSIRVKTEYKNRDVKLCYQFVSDSYFNFFNYEIINENQELFSGNENALFVYINESALEKLGIPDVAEAVGTKVLSANNHELIICGVVKDYYNLCIRPSNQAKIYQIKGEHLAYAFYNKSELSGGEDKILAGINLLSFQDIVQNRFRFIGDIIYTLFLLINAVILIIGIGYIGNKYASRKERKLYKILGIGVHVLTLIISKAYIYILVFIGFVAGPLAFLIKKLWLEMYEYRIQFGMIDLFIILSVVVLTLYLVCCSKTEFNSRLEKEPGQTNSI